MNGFKLTGLGSGSASGDSINYDQYILKADYTALAATTGAALVGVLGGGTVQAAITALNGAVSGVNFNDTSTTSLTIGTGSKSLTVSTGKPFVVGQFINIANTAAPSNYMIGQITSYTAGTGALVVNVTTTNGSGTFTAWTISLAAPVTPFIGGTLSIPLIATASGAGAAGLNVAPGTAPTAPANGDVWTTGAALFVRVGGVTKQLAATSDIAPFAGGSLSSLLITAASVAGSAGLNLPHGVAPSTPNNGDVWTTTAAVFARINGVTTQLLSSASLATYAPLASPAFTGAPTAPTASLGTATTQIATTAFADALRDIPINSQGAYALTLADRGKAVLVTGNVTVPANSATAFPVGSAVTIINANTTTLTIAITTDTLTLAGTTTTGSRTLAPNGIATLVKKSATSWLIGGNVT